MPLPPGPDRDSIASLFDAPMQAERAADLEATLTTMAADPQVLNAGSGTGGQGHDGVHDVSAHHLMGQMSPPETEFLPISRTIDAERLVDEREIHVTHTNTIRQLLPGVAPSGRRGEVELVRVVGVRDGKLAYEPIDWDQASVLVQRGLVDPGGFPIAVDATVTPLAFTSKDGARLSSLGFGAGRGRSGFGGVGDHPVD